MFFDFLAASLLPADVSFTYAWLPEDECHFITRTFFNITEVILSLPEGIEPPTQVKEKSKFIQLHSLNYPGYMSCYTNLSSP